MAELEKVNARTGLIAESEQTEKSNIMGNIDKSRSAKSGATSGHGECRKKFRLTLQLHAQRSYASRHENRLTVNTLFCQHWMLFLAIAIKTLAKYDSSGQCRTLFAGAHRSLIAEELLRGAQMTSAMILTSQELGHCQPISFCCQSHSFCVVQCLFFKSPCSLHRRGCNVS